MPARTLFDDAAYSKLYSTDKSNYGLAVEWPLSTQKSYPASPYPQFSDLPPEAQTVLFDLDYVGLFTYSDPFWHDMTATEWQLAVSDLNKLANANASGYKSRILDDANLLQQLPDQLPIINYVNQSAGVSISRSPLSGFHRRSGRTLPGQHPQ
jgi:hypothetical protein